MWPEPGVVALILKGRAAVVLSNSVCGTPPLHPTASCALKGKGRVRKRERSTISAVKRSLLLAVVAMAAVLGGSLPAAADEGWVIKRFDVTYTVQPDGTIDAVEEIEVDFTPLQKRGIFRYFFLEAPCATPYPGAQQPTVACPPGQDREWRYEIREVTNFSGDRLKYAESVTQGRREVKIGDADVFVTGVQEYRIAYRLRGALDAYEDHDELYWDVTGLNWPVKIETFSMTLTLPEGASANALCFQGYEGSDEQCTAAADENTARYASTRELSEGEGVTIVAGWQKGLVDVPPPLIEDPLTLRDMYELDPLEFAGMAGVGALAVGLLGMVWWREGRDRRYKSLYYLTNDPSEHTRPLFGSKDVVVEFLPPEDLRPAQMGVLMDERADTLDVTATIVDMAVRGYLHITELPKESWFGKKDWKLTKLKEKDGLNAFELRLFDALFKKGDEVELSDLRYTFAADLNRSKELIYEDAMKRKWFRMKPESARAIWFVTALALLAFGAAFALLAGYYWGRALIFLPVLPAALVLMVLSRSMASRTAAGSEALRRVLGFRLYITTAETRRQEFNEQENIFARYLPFAIVFGAVGKWAKAFEGLDNAAAKSTASWYTGTGAFHVASFSSGMQSFSSSVSSTIASTQSSSSGGGSGFGGGGSSGGGGGGGGGGSW